MGVPHIEIPYERLRAFCRKWNLTEIALFGSVLRDDFRKDSDVDVLVTFAPHARRGLFVLAEMEQELGQLFGHQAHVITRGAVEASHNPYRRKIILDSAQVIHVT